MLFGVGARHFDAVPFQRAAEVTRHIVPLVRSLDPPLLLPQMECMHRHTAGKLDLHVPAAGHVGLRRAGGDAGDRLGGFESRAWSRSATILSSPGSIMYAVMETPVSAAAAVSPRPARPPPPPSAIRGSVFQRVSETSRPGMPSFSLSQRIVRPGLRFDRPWC